MQDNDDWITIKRKKPNNFVKTKETKLVAAVPPPIREHFRPLRKTDFTLTDEEMIRFKDELAPIFCGCCQTTEVQRIIGRPFMKCGLCYCCDGNGESIIDDNVLCVLVNDALTKTKVLYKDTLSYTAHENLCDDEYDTRKAYKHRKK